MGPPPPLGRPWAGPGRGGCLLFGLASPRSRSPDRPTDPVPPSGGPLGIRRPRTEAAGTPEPGPRACVDRGGGRLGAWGTGRLAGRRDSQPGVSPPEHRCVESAKIRAKYPDRVPVSGLPAPSPHCHLCLLGLVMGPKPFKS